MKKTDPDLNVEDDTNNKGPSFKPDHVIYGDESETSVVESTSQLYYPQEEEEKYFDTEATNLSWNAGRKLSCDSCEYQTKNSSHLRAHKIGKHEGIKFKCDQCDRQFSSKTNLQAHQHSKQEGKIYYSGECVFQTSHSTTLSKHKTKCHKQL